MNIFKISIVAFLVQVVLMMPASAETSAKNCKYLDQSILVVASSDEATCAPNLLCVANLSCEDGFGKKEKSVACGAIEGKCPSIEKCIEDRKVYYKEEVKIGEAGKHIWKSYAIGTFPMIIKAHAEYKAERLQENGANKPSGAK